MAENKDLLQRLINNNFDTNLAGIVLNISTTDVENTIMRYLEHKGVDTTGVNVRCVSKSMCNNSDYLRGLAKDSPLPFIVVLFRKVQPGQMKKKTSVREEVLRNLNRTLKNYSDRTQFSINMDDEFNKAIDDIAYHDNHGNIRWVYERKSKKAHVALSPAAIWYLGYDLTEEDCDKLQFDFLNNEKIITNRQTYMREALYTVAITYVKSKRKPTVDDISRL